MSSGYAEVLPLAFTMMLGPQILTSIVLITSRRPIRASLAYIAGIFCSTLAGTLAFYFLARLIHITPKEPQVHELSNTAVIVQMILVVVLIIMTIRTYINRSTVKLPSWMTMLQNASPRTALRTGFVLIFLMPMDVIIMSTVGTNLAANGSDSPLKFVPFLVATTVIAAVPLIGYLLFREKAVIAMPKVRQWMETSSWVITLLAYGIFLFLIWPRG